MKDDFSLMNPKSTKFHVADADLSDWETNFPEANVTFVGDLTPTGINEAIGKLTDVRGEVYNLSGQRVSDSYKGIVIMNGRKYMMK